MENKSKAEYYAYKIANESRHKIINITPSNRAMLIEELKKYPINGNEPAVVYLEMTGLPKNSNKSLDKDRIKILHRDYWNSFIASGILNSVIENNLSNINILERNLLNYFVHNHGITPKNINDYVTYVKNTEQEFLSLYKDYVEKGKINEYSGNFILLDYFMRMLKQVLERDKHISVVLDNSKLMSRTNYQAINDLINSRNNGVLSVNILTTPEEWLSYYDLQGNFVEAVHDYENIVYDESYQTYMLKRINRENN